MPLEIERKFLPKNKEWKEVPCKRILHIEQGYIARTSEGNVVRIRMIDSAAEKSAVLCIKGRRGKNGAPEFEFEVPLRHAIELMRMCGSNIIKKWRYEVEYKNHLFEIDEFLGHHEGLTVIEVELTHKDEPVELPDWIGEEVTNDSRYANAYMAEHGIPK